MQERFVNQTFKRTKIKLGRCGACSLPNAPVAANPLPPSVPKPCSPPNRPQSQTKIPIRNPTPRSGVQWRREAGAAAAAPPPGRLLRRAPKPPSAPPSASEPPAELVAAGVLGLSLPQERWWSAPGTVLAVGAQELPLSRREALLVTPAQGLQPSRRGAGDAGPGAAALGAGRGAGDVGPGAADVAAGLVDGDVGPGAADVAAGLVAGDVGPGAADVAAEHGRGGVARGAGAGAAAATGKGLGRLQANSNHQKIPLGIHALELEVYSAEKYLTGDSETDELYIRLASLFNTYRDKYILMREKSADGKASKKEKLKYKKAKDHLMRQIGATQQGLQNRNVKPFLFPKTLSKDPF